MDRLLAAVLNHRRTGNPKVLLTTVGGAFGSEREWFIRALRALRCMHNRPLDVAIGCFGRVSPDLADLAAEVNAGISHVSDRYLLTADLPCRH